MLVDIFGLKSGNGLGITPYANNTGCTNRSSACGGLNRACTNHGSVCDSSTNYMQSGNTCENMS